MSELENMNGDVVQNLQATDCDADLIRKFSQYWQEGNRKAQIRLLQTHRCSLLEKLHTAQKDLDRIDYFIYEMKKAIGQRG